ncbi:hypothetical protein BDV93DRAFT_224280 [Ceratobasidium sp. AG-I]|nr:hypothetical protein BDV93DRAFT_224280 [Ceratobasidium sp. AG-I]
MGEFDPTQIFGYLAANPEVMAGFAAMITTQQQKGRMTPKELPGTSNDNIQRGHSPERRPRLSSPSSSHESHSGWHDTQRRSNTITLTTQGNSAAPALPRSTPAPSNRSESHAPPSSPSRAPCSSSPSVKSQRQEQTTQGMTGGARACPGQS